MSFVVDAPPVVVDASAAIELLGGDARWRETFELWAAEDRLLLSPALFLTEVANGQLRGQKAPVGDVALRIERLAASRIETADRGLRGLLEAIDLADRHGLTVYDALYLQLALDVDGELATLDSRLRDAADAEGVTLVPDHG